MDLHQRYLAILHSCRQLAWSEVERPADGLNFLVPVACSMYKTYGHSNTAGTVESACGVRKKGDAQTMADYQALKRKLGELAERKWDVISIEARCKALMTRGFSPKVLNAEEIVSHTKEILDRVERHAEEYNFFVRNCARSTAMAVMEEFGLGNMEVIKALSPFPGFGGTGWMCGGVTGGLVALGLFKGSEDPMNFEAMGAAIQAARRFMARFEQEVGAVTCPKIHEDIVFGRYMDPAASPENMNAFEEAQGFEKCGLLPGIGARIAAEIIIENLAAQE
jgi:C_GCAxxG_C_C family probable redox protein